MWKHPWQLEKFDNIYNKDERFFSILVKGLIAWFNKNIVLYNKPIKHFILSTGSSYMYVETNGYEFTLSETSGEDWVYMEMPRCIIEISDISFNTDSLTNCFSRGEYERYDDETNSISGYNAEIMRVPIEMNFQFKYVLSNFNESIVLLQEIIDKFIYQKFFTIIYLGQKIRCGIEFTTSAHPELNKIDFSSNETNQKILQFDIKLTSNYPAINERTEVSNANIINSSKFNVNLLDGNKSIDKEINN